MIKILHHKNIKFIFCLLILIVVFIDSKMVYADNQSSDIEKELNKNIDMQLDILNFEELEVLLGEFQSDTMFNGSFRDKVQSITQGDFRNNTATFLESIVKLILSSFTDILPLLASIAAVAILSGLVTNLRSQTFSNSTSELVFCACYALIILIVITGVNGMYNTAENTINTIKQFSDVILPILLTLMVASQGNISAKVYQPAIALFSGGVIEIIYNFILPLFMVTMVFSVISNMSKNIKLDKLASFFRSLAVWALGTVFMIFSSFLTVRGISAGTIDGISLRAAKFATKSYIPILGGYLSDGMDLFIAGSVLIKNAVGTAGLSLLLLIIISPILKMVVFALGLKFVASAVQSITDNRISNFITSVSKNISILYVSLIAIAFMLFIMIMLIIMTANVII